MEALIEAQQRKQFNLELVKDFFDVLVDYRVEMLQVRAQTQIFQCRPNRELQHAVCLHCGRRQNCGVFGHFVLHGFNHVA